MTQGLCQNGTRVMSKWHNKDSSIIDPSIKILLLIVMVIFLENSTSF